MSEDYWEIVFTLFPKINSTVGQWGNDNTLGFPIQILFLPMKLALEHEVGLINNNI